MAIPNLSPFENYGIIAYLSGKFTPTPPTQFGKTALQKIIYILQGSCNVPLNYHFEFFTHGPYSRKLSNDLELAEYNRAIKINKEEMGTNISQGEKSEEFISLVHDFISKYDNDICRVLADFGGYNAKELEVRATLIFIYNYFKNEKKSREKLIDIFISSKPYFGTAEIGRALDELVQKNYVILEN